MAQAAAALEYDEDAFDAAAALRQYKLTISFIERLHRLLLDVIKDEFERLRIAEINSVQALLLFNIGAEELTAGELKGRGYYQGSNVSYNLKKLVENGFLHHQRCNVDRRAVRIKLTDKGREIHELVGKLHARHACNFMSMADDDERALEELNDRMERLETFWRKSIRYIY